MKINNLTKIIFIIVILLSASLAIKAANLGYIYKKTYSSNIPPIAEDNFENNLDKDQAETKYDETNNKVLEDHTIELPTIVDSTIVENPINEKPLTEDSISNENEQDNSKDNKTNNNSNKKNNSNKSKNNNGNNKKENDKEKNKLIVNSKIMTEDEAIEIGLKKIGSKAYLIAIESNLDNNPPKYVLKLNKNKLKYTLEIHAITGTILDSIKE